MSEQLNKAVSNETIYEQSGVAMTCRSFAEYSRMFMLDGELPPQGAAVLDVAAGASSFTAELSKRGYAAVACDPRYALSAEEMHQHGLEEHHIASGKLAAKQQAFVWNDYSSLQEHDEHRLQSLRQFIEHYRENKSNAARADVPAAEHKSSIPSNDSSNYASSDYSNSSNSSNLSESGNSSVADSFGSSSYVTASLPNLPFADNSFELVLCNHFLFLYQEQFDYSFHLQAILELLRITKPGGRIVLYPLVGFRNELYPQLAQLQQELTNSGAQVSLRETTFRFLPAADSFLQVIKQA